MLHILFFVSLFSSQGSGGLAPPVEERQVVLQPPAKEINPCCWGKGILSRFAGCPALVGSNGLEPSTSRLSGVRSNHLSYEPMFVAVRCHFLGQPVCLRLSLYPFRDYVSCDSQFLKRVLLGAAVVEMNRIELSTPCLQGRCSPS